MDEYIEREATIKLLRSLGSRDYRREKGTIQEAIKMVSFPEYTPSADVVPVRHGRWELTVHSFYSDTFDESCELCVYIVANCSECSGNHPNSYQVFSKTIYAPEDAGYDFRLDQKEEENKAIQEFQRSNYQFAYYCPNCGAKMDGGYNDATD